MESISKAYCKRMLLVMPAHRLADELAQSADVLVRLLGAELHHFLDRDTIKKSAINLHSISPTLNNRTSLGNWNEIMIINSL